MPKIIIAEYHDQVYDYWLSNQMQNIKVAHIDFHCDMSNLYLNRRRKTAQFKSGFDRKDIDPGNYLGHAIMNRIATDVRWVHCSESGRPFDHGPVVSYETDIGSMLHRIRNFVLRGKKADIQFEETDFSGWSGLSVGEQLDLDWDALASVEFSDDHKTKLINQFLEKDFKVIPEITFFVYSPTYSDPNRKLFEDFATKLAKKFDAEIEYLPLPALVPETETVEPRSIKTAIKNITPRWLITLKRFFETKLRAYNARQDLEYFGEEKTL